jgi:hypothetical protein
MYVSVITTLMQNTISIAGLMIDKATYRPVVVMGSDDPGIFSTNIFNEYAHVFMSMKDKRVHAHHAINKIRELVGHSQNYGFGG